MPVVEHFLENERNLNDSNQKSALTAKAGLGSTLAPDNDAAGESAKCQNIFLESILMWCYGTSIDMATVTVSPKFQIVIPRDVREGLVMAPGDKIEVIQLEGRIELIPVRSASSLKGFLKGRENTFQREGDRCLP